MAGHGSMRKQQEQQGLPGPDAEGYNASRALLPMPTSTASLRSSESENEADTQS